MHALISESANSFPSGKAGGQSSSTGETIIRKKSEGFFISEKSSPASFSVLSDLERKEASENMRLLVHHASMVIGLSYIFCFSPQEDNRNRLGKQDRAAAQVRSRDSSTKTRVVHIVEKERTVFWRMINASVSGYVCAFCTDRTLDCCIFFLFS